MVKATMYHALKQNLLNHLKHQKGGEKMEAAKERPDYSLERVLTDKPEKTEHTKIMVTVQLEVQSHKESCQGHCHQDYAPG